MPFRSRRASPEEKLLVLPDYLATELAGFELTKNFYVSDIGYFPRARHHYRERHDGCDSHIVIYCADGAGWIELDGRTDTLSSRQLAVIPAGTPHRYGASAESPWSIYWFHLRGEQVAAHLGLYGLAGQPTPMPAGLEARFAESFERCYGLLADKPYSLPAQVHVSQTLGQLLGAIGLSAAGSPRHRKREEDLERAVRYMNGRLHASVTLPELAAHAGLSKQHLIHLFKQETGFPPIDYYLRLKMQKAGQLLSLTGMSVKEIAAAVGFGDPYYFSRMFKKLMGASPTDYRSVPKG
ncbi:AraC family transcriptional regulator [Cohnella ginsengisoli]|uniref:AraC family transcriptional regulator n=1 Tax=Cohnella ginsengisoli TaxID=425004 RepID=A0A9X4QPF7_9BACL|nr:AraC family transcriptional regulator [Cohnella ginsengisoli]MDG0793462.1 AraC family transcriptional regulator [Cohnella ginsengisoli]